MVPFSSSNSFFGKRDKLAKQLWIAPLQHPKKPSVTCTHEVIMTVTMTISTTLKLASISSMHRALSLQRYITHNISYARISIYGVLQGVLGKRQWLYDTLIIESKELGHLSDLLVDVVPFWGLCIWARGLQPVWKAVGPWGSGLSLEEVVHWSQNIETFSTASLSVHSLMLIADEWPAVFWSYSFPFLTTTDCELLAKMDHSSLELLLVMCLVSATKTVTKTLD